MAVASACGCVGGILPRNDRGRSVCSTAKEQAKEPNDLETLECHVRDTGCKFKLERLARETLCDGHWEVFTCVPCVAYNETEDSLVMFHGDDFLAEGHDSSAPCLRGYLCWFSALCVGCDMVQADHAPDGGVAQGIFHGILVRHHSEIQEEVEVELGQELKGQEEENTQEQVRMPVTMDEND